jgi:phosphoglycolate phosphatase-like HAD superfamily hydrolase
MRRRDRVLPGTREALQALAELAQIAESVVTGTPRLSTEAKLAIFGVADLLDVDSGAYGTDDSVGEPCRQAHTNPQTSPAAGGSLSHYCR